MQAPKTIDELEKVMDAFKNQNPDGLAPDKVTPLSIGFKTTMNTWMGDPSWIFGAYGTLPQQWNLDADGKLEYGSVNAGMKQGLEKLKEWLAKGYIPQRRLFGMRTKLPNQQLQVQQGFSRVLTG